MSAAATLRAHLGERKPLAMVLGSGLGGLVDAIEGVTRISYADLEGFPHSGVSGHAGEAVIGRIARTDVIVLSGRAHYYEQGRADAMRPVLETLHAVGVSQLLLTNSAGSVNQDMEPGSVMLIKDHINLTGMNPLIGEPTDGRFVGMTSAYSKPMRKRLRAAAESAGVELHRGVYMWFSGPSFETPAEIRMARKLGADAVGMSTVPEVILARFLGMEVAAMSCITNFGAGMTGAELSHDETKEVAPRAGERLARVLAKALEDWS